MDNLKTQKTAPIKACFKRVAALCAALALAFTLASCSEAAAGLYNAASAMVRDAKTQIMGQSSGESEGQSSQATDTQTEQALKMHFIDVGQALSVLVECGGQYMLYDGGNSDDGALVLQYLQSHGVQRLEYVFCSHAHEDHVGGLGAVLTALPAGHVYSPVTQAEDSASFSYFAECVSELGMQLEVPAAGTSWQLGGATVRLLGPLKQYEDNTNNTSLVLRVDYGGASFLLVGDMERDAELDLVDSGVDLSANVLQVGHHGSSDATSYAFLNAVLPEIAVISCGAGNDYGHPHEQTLSRLRDAGADVYRTDLSGTITVATDGANYTIGYESFASDTEQNPTIGNAD